MSEEQKVIKRSELFIDDYEKLLNNPALSERSKKRAEEDIKAMRNVVIYADRYVRSL